MILERGTGQDSGAQDQQQIDQNGSKERGLDDTNLVVVKGNTIPVSWPPSPYAVIQLHATLKLVTHAIPGRAGKTYNMMTSARLPKVMLTRAPTVSPASRAIFSVA